MRVPTLTIVQVFPRPLGAFRASIRLFMTETTIA